MGYSWSAALADEMNLDVPNRADANVKLTLQSENTDENPSHHLQVFVGNLDACCAGKSPIAGHYLIDGRHLIFDPAFDFVEGQSYVVQSRDNGSEENLKEFMIQPDGEIASPRVVAIYPSGSAIPENSLRFYIHFSTPMRPHAAGDFIKLVDSNGAPDTAAFMSFKQELWSEDRMRLTLLMDPGRIKRGVAQNLELGPALLENNNYTLVIEEGWASARGTDTAPRFEKPFTVSQALRTLPDTDLWQISLPRTSTREPLVIEFDRPFDRELAQAGITVLNLDGHFIPGTVFVENHEKTWRFKPQAAWPDQSVQIKVDARLEDVAGNNFTELLDHSVGIDVETMNSKRITLELQPL